MPELHSYKQRVLSVLLCLSPSLVLGQNGTAETLESCLSTAGVRATISTDSTWSTDTASFQSRLPPQPAAVAFPANKDQVALSLACARDAAVKVSVVGRAHSFQGYGFGNPGNLVIDMESFTDLSFDASTNELRFGGGANVGPAAKFLWDGHKRHFPHVRGSHVGLVGSTMGGGFGTTCRVLGLPVDNLASVEYMLYNGSIVNAGPGSDLLWAAQGAGANFGVVLSATTKTYEAPYDGAVSYSLALGNVTNKDAAAAVLAIQKWSTSGQAPDGLSLRFSVANFASAGFFYGNETAFDSAFAPLLTSLRTLAPSLNLTKTIIPTFWDAELASAGPGMNLPTGGSLGGRASLVQSWATTRNRPLTLDQVNTLITSYQALNRTDMTLTGFLDLWGGVSRDIKDKDTSYAHGDNLWLVRVDGVATAGVWPSNGVAYMQNLMKPFGDALQQSGPLRGFVNYVDSELSVKEWSSRLYGANFGKLQKIKAAVDPKGLFSGFGLAIPIARRQRY